MLSKCAGTILVLCPWFCTPGASALTDGGYSTGQQRHCRCPWTQLMAQKRPGAIGRPCCSCVVFGAYTVPTKWVHRSPTTGARTCGWAHLRPAPCVSGACLGPNEGAQPAGLPPGPHLAWHGERPGYLVKRAVLACLTADPGPHGHNCSLPFRFSDAPGIPFDGLFSGPDLGR